MKVYGFSVPSHGRVIHLVWEDGSLVSVGHNGTMNGRRSPHYWRWFEADNNLCQEIKLDEAIMRCQNDAAREFLISFREYGGTL